LFEFKAILAYLQDYPAAESASRGNGLKELEKLMAKIKEIRVPDIGNFKNVAIIEIQVQPGQRIEAEQTLLTLESDKAAMEIPAPEAGVVQEIAVKIGDHISEGDVILRLEIEDKAQASPPAAKSELAPPPSRAVPQPATPPPVTAKQAPPPPTRIDDTTFVKAHASPAVRKFARELGVDLGKISGSGRSGRIQKEDVQGFVKAELGKPRSAPAAGGGLGLPEMPAVDFAQFGEIETKPLSRIQKISSATLHRNWLLIPHVTQHDQADITELETFRKDLGEEAGKRGVKVTLLAFLMKACVGALKSYPTFNASLAPDKESIVLKKYFHVGFAVDTPGGLVVPVIRDVDKMGLFDIAAELGRLSIKARDGKLSPADMQGGCFTISSLGGIGGTAFTPIINAPEVAILGVSRSQMQPVWQNNQFVPRLILPMSLSYDHRVIDGAQAARFTAYLSFLLSDVRRLLV
jgi:pyruvate dehydrogenase E2 component (dihydrolipoamide acetyltransferase)